MTINRETSVSRVVNMKLNGDNLIKADILAIYKRPADWDEHN